MNVLNIYVYIFSVTTSERVVLMTTVNFKTTFFVFFSISYVRDEHMKRGIKTIN